jgi:hypothetical protein
MAYNNVWPWSQSDTSHGASIFGALPASFQLGAPSLGVADLVSFHFAAFDPNILNCTVVGPRSIVYYKVVTDSDSSATVLRDNQNAHTAVLEWHRQPCIEMKDNVPRQKISEWLPLSSNKTSRKMLVNNVLYRWMPFGNDVYVGFKLSGLYPRRSYVYCQLTTADGSRGLGRITKTTGIVTLELTVSALCDIQFLLRS